MRFVVSFLAVFTSSGLAHAADTPDRGSIILAQVPDVCAQVYQPVCGSDATGKRVTYSNDCIARVAKATNVTPGECPK